MSKLKLFVPEKTDHEIKVGDLLVSRNDNQPHKPFYLVVEVHDTFTSCVKIETISNGTKTFSTKYSLMDMVDVTFENYALSLNGYQYLTNKGNIMGTIITQKLFTDVIVTQSENDIIIRQTNLDKSNTSSIVIEKESIPELAEILNNFDV